MPGLQTAVALLPETERAWRSGEITTEQARLIGRAAVPETDGQWLLFAREATFKLLEAAVRYSEVELPASKPPPPWSRCSTCFAGQAG